MVIIFQPTAPEDEQDSLREQFAQMAKSKARRAVSGLNIHPEKKGMLEAEAHGLASKYAMSGRFDEDRIDEWVDHLAESVRANILKPEEGDYEPLKGILRETVRQWAGQPSV